MRITLDKTRRQKARAMWLFNETKLRTLDQTLQIYSTCATTALPKPVAVVCDTTIHRAGHCLNQSGALRVVITEQVYIVVKINQHAGLLQFTVSRLSIFTPETHLVGLRTM